MAGFRPLKFIKASGTLGITSVALAVVLFIVSIIEHVRDKNVPAYVFVYAAAIFFAVGAYIAWSAEADKLDEERAKNQKPLLKVELMAAFFDVSQVPGTQDAQVHVYAYLRVANLSDTATLMKNGVLKMVVGGIEHTGKGDDISVSGNWLEHNSGFRLGGEKKGSVFSETFTPVRRLVADISWEYPLVKGVHRDGIMVFTFRGNMEWDPENLYTIPATELRLSLTDTFDQEHTVTIPKFDIHAGTLCKPGDRQFDAL